MKLLAKYELERLHSEWNRSSGDSHHLKPVLERVAGIDEDRVVAVHPRPAGDARADRVVIADRGRGFDPALEQAADDALMHELIARPQPAAAGELRHAGRGAGAAGGAVDGALAVEHRVAGMRARVARRAGPLHVADACDRGIVRMRERDRRVDALAYDRGEPQDGVGRYCLQPRIVLLRLDDGVEIAAIGDVEHDLAEL